MSKIIGYEFTVTGGGIFPFDMLRYDACHPHRQEDVSLLGQGFRGYGGGSVERRSVEMVSNVKPPSIERWMSFGWAVSNIEVIR